MQIGNADEVPDSTSQVLNVQVPFYFKSIVDSLNIDFAAVGGTAWTVGGAMILACMQTPYHLSSRILISLCIR